MTIAKYQGVILAAGQGSRMAKILGEVNTTRDLLTLCSYYVSHVTLQGCAHKDF